MDNLNDGHSKRILLIFGAIQWKVQPQQILLQTSRLTIRSRLLSRISAPSGSKFSAQDVSALKGRADLVSQVAAKYGLTQMQAQTDVDALLKGRAFGSAA
jgi:hypothetical protein